MSKGRQVTKQRENVVTPPAQAVTQAETMEDFARELVQAFELEVKAAKERMRGQSIPYADIIEGVDMIFDQVQVDKAPINLLADKVDKLLEFKYSKMSDAHNTVIARVGAKVVEMEACNLKALRIGQLKHMRDPKVKDNLYRRIYGLGYRKEFKRFDMIDGSLHRISKLNKDEEAQPTS